MNPQISNSLSLKPVKSTYMKKGPLQMQYIKGSRDGRLSQIGPKLNQKCNYNREAQGDMPENLENSRMATRLERVSFHSNPKEGQCQGMFKLLHICPYFTCQQGNAKILQDRLQQYVKRELSDVKAGFRKNRGIRHQVANICWIIEKAREFQKNIYFCFIDYAKALTVWVTTNCGKFSKRWEYQTTLPAS